jgi:hypothetical protein
VGGEVRGGVGDSLTEEQSTMGFHEPNNLPSSEKHLPPADVLGLGHPLRPDLYRFVRLERGPADMRTMMLNHPLLSVEIEDFDKCQAIHYAVDEATDSLEEALEASDWRGVIYRHDERYRLRAFCEYAHLLSERDYWGILGDLYREYQTERTLSDAFPEVLLFHHLLQSQRPHREFLMTEEDRALFARLPSSFTVYRGFASGDGSGISWTLDRRVAVFFAHLEWERSDGRCTPMVLTAVVPNKCRAIAFFTKETELLVPMPGVSVLASEEVTKEAAVHPLTRTFSFDEWLASCLDV